MGNIRRIKYFTKDKLALINPENVKLYDRYLKSNTIKNKDVKDTTYKVYKNYMNHFLVYLAEEWDNVGLYDELFFENAIDIMEGFIGFCQETLFNNKKVINTKISTISSFYNWSVKRHLVSHHPFDKELERMKNASEEKIIASHFLTEEEIDYITKELKDNNEYDIIDNLIWNLMISSANRVGAIEKLTLSSLDLENMMFVDIREKRGYLVEVAFDDNSKELIEQWLEMRKDMDNLENDAFFITKYKKSWHKMSKGTIQKRIKKIGHILGLDDFRSHSIRKTALNQVYEQTGDLNLAAEMGNHKSVETTRSSYIKKPSKSEVRAKIEKLKAEKKNKKDSN